MTTSRNYSLPTDGVDNSNVTSGAFLPVTCNSGFMNVGGPLNITCINGVWTPLPNCVPISGGGSGGVTTTLATVTSGRCPYNNATFTIAYAFLSNTSSLLQYPDTSTASGIRLALEPKKLQHFSVFRMGDVFLHHRLRSWPSHRRSPIVC